MSLDDQKYGTKMKQLPCKMCEVPWYESNLDRHGICPQCDPIAQITRLEDVILRQGKEIDALKKERDGDE